MCGIAGLATADGCANDDVQKVRRMLESLAHRGPDDQHDEADTHAVIGSRRLSIIDLDSGRQPLTNEDGFVVVSQNGEIYNYIELRDTLSKRGHRFRTQGDTEVIAHAYEEYGDAFVDHLRGMFAIAVWDRARRRLVLARDRLGKKPIYWRLLDGRLSYGSELKAVLACDDLERIVDRQSLGLYLRYQYVPAPRTILQSVHKLPPASVLAWDGTGDPVIHRYWAPSYQPKVERSEAADVEHCRRLLEESVRLRMRSDVPVGVFLSGGMDSSVVTALMAGLSERPIKSFSIGFEEQDFDELPYARAVARHFGTDHTDAVVSLDAIDLLPALARHFDEPFGDQSAVPTMRVAELASAEVKVVLTGDGGDEAFGGYLRYRADQGIGRFGALPAPAQRALARSTSAILGRVGNARWSRRGRTLERLVGMDADERYVAMMTILHEEERRGLLGSIGADDAYLTGILGDGGLTGLDRLLRLDTLTYLPEDLLVKVDRATMASSLEARAPLLDHRLIEFAASLPVDRKLRGRQSKWLLRQVARSLMPAHLVDRPKQGFGVPVGSWFRSTLGERFRDLVLAPDSRLRDHMDATVASRLLDEHQAERADHGHRLWVLLMFELWARTWASPSEEAVG